MSDERRLGVESHFTDGAAVSLVASVQSLVTSQIVPSHKVFLADIALIVGFTEMGQLNVSLQVQIVLELLLTQFTADHFAFQVTFHVIAHRGLLQEPEI